MKNILKFLLKSIVSRVIGRYDPYIIAVTGSVGKTSTKDAIYDAFSGFRKIRKSAGNLNTEIGAPLVFLGVERPGESAWSWFIILLRGISLLLKKDKNYPDIIITELAADKPGDIGYLSEFIKPDIAIITAIGNIPVHVEFYKSPEEVAQEKEKLIYSLSPNKKVILNKDDRYVSKMKTKAEKITFGFSEESDAVIKRFQGNNLNGILTLIEYNNKEYEISLPKCIGNHFAYLAASVFLVGVCLEIPAEKIPKMMKRIRPVKGRFYPIKGINDSTILDGSYNAAPHSMMSSLDTLKDISAKKKIAVLGDMLEIGNYSAEEHRKIGKKAASICDYAFFVGEWANEMKKAALLAGMSEERAFSFSNVEEMIPKLENIISSQSLVLVKGSQRIRLEKAIFSVMHNPEDAEDLLVRQTLKWKRQ